MYQRLTIDYVKSYIEEHLYTLIEKEYINAHVKLKMICPNGHINFRSFDSFKRGHRCRVCRFESIYNKQRHSFEYIKNYIENKNYKLLSDNYINARTILIIKCPKEHIFKTDWNGFQQKGRCPICYGTPKKTIKEIRKFSKSINYTLLSKKYKNALDKLKFRCDNGHIFEVSWNNISGKSGSRCPICWLIKNRGPFHHNWKGGISFEEYCEIFKDKEFKDYIKYRDGYKCLNPICSRKSKTLSVHHIDYNKKNCNQENLITLCISCNSKANVNREWYIDWYRTIMYKRYKFIYKGV